jgi:adenylate cyclase
MQRADQPLLPIALTALEQAGAPPPAGAEKSRRMRMVTADVGYAVTLTTLAFPDWTLATVIPEAEFLGPIETTRRRWLATPNLIASMASNLSKR